MRSDGRTFLILPHHREYSSIRVSLWQQHGERKLITMASRRRRKMSSRSNSWASDGSGESGDGLIVPGKPLEPPTLVYHSSARSIVFRDQLRRASVRNLDVGANSGDELNVEKAADTGSAFLEDSQSPSSKNPLVKQTPAATPRIVPLPPLELSSDGAFEPLLKNELTSTLLTKEEQEVITWLQQQTAAVKTIQNAEWNEFLKRFLEPQQTKRPSPVHPDRHDEKDDSTFNSFVTSTSLLPPLGKKMRAYGSDRSYAVGVVFRLPQFDTPQEEDQAVASTHTWAWPAGYAAKTEFNVSRDGRLINGRQEALVTLSTMRQYNLDYLDKESYVVANKRVSGFSIIPYNELYLRVGGSPLGPPSLQDGVGLPVALFVRNASYGHLIAMMRSRARMQNMLGKEHFQGLPLLCITPEHGVRVLTMELQEKFWEDAAQRLNPFQNPTISYKTSGPRSNEAFVHQKMSELIDLDDTVTSKLTPEELARLAGGFGATDKSVERILTQVVEDDTTSGSSQQKLSDVVNEGLAYAVRSGDYRTSRQLLILYSIVAARQADKEDEEDEEENEIGGAFSDVDRVNSRELLLSVRALDLSTGAALAAPPPPPLDTDRLRSATNSDGLLAVLGAAQVLRAMKDGSAKKRTEEVISALEEWVEHGEHSVAFRIASWQKQKAAQGDLNINVEHNSNFMAFAGKKAITNRKHFASRLHKAAEATDFTDARFLLAIKEVISTLHSPCLRLELLQYVLGLDNRYSVAHVARSVELATTCLCLAATGSYE